MHEKIKPNSVVVVTGASAGVGRAVAEAFAGCGARVALLAREPQRLEAARQAIEAMGTRALAIPVDVADEQQVEAAAERVERELGPIDIWVNNAMVTVVGPAQEITPEELRRVTDVTYHGTVWGTLAALRRMGGRGRGSIVQIGSALAYRSIPLQAPYCAAKHAVMGFTESLRSELIHAGSEIHVGMVQLPAVNTPQFEWCRTKMPNHPQPVGRIYQPEVIAEAVLHLVETRRRELYVTFSAAQAIWGDKVAPGLLDHYLAQAAWEGQALQEPVSPGRQDNLFEPVPGPYGAHGRFDERAVPFSKSLWANMHRGWLLAGAALAVGLLATGRGRGSLLQGGRTRPHLRG
jgi:NAD(P)-dependent dehydrogenase (short-subunit alcohol dehydrogenase family)